MRAVTKRLNDFTFANGDEIELELGFKPSDYHDVIVQETDDLIVMGYLVHDDDCSNPLEDCCAIGTIHHHPRSNYGKRGDDGYYEALALDSYGEPIIDEDKVQKVWHDKVMALPLELFTLPEKFFADDEAQRAWRILNRDVDAALLRQDLAGEGVDDVPILTYCRYAWRSHDLPDLLEEELSECIEDALAWNYEGACEDCHKEGDPDAVLLDLYDHSGLHWSLSGGGMNCQWDTSRGESVWVPDDELRKYLDEIKDPAERWKQAKVYAQQAVDEYNAWTSGDCYGVVVQTHDKEGELIESDECWGYVGGEYAEMHLKDQVAYYTQKKEAAA